MTDPLFLADISGACPGSSVVVDGPEGRHAASVKRMRVGESVLLADGEGAGLRGVVEAVDKSSIRVNVSELIERPDPALRVIAVQALAKGERSDIAVEAMTELGVGEIVAWQASRSVVRWENKADKGIAKWTASAVAATKQSRRFRVPKISYADTSAVCELLPAADIALILHESATMPLSSVELPQSGTCVIVIGPEGGISDEELAQFEAAGATPVLISDAVLRASTAGVVALAMLKVIGLPR